MPSFTCIIEIVEIQVLTFIIVDVCFSMGMHSSPEIASVTWALELHKSAAARSWEGKATPGNTA